MFVVEKIEDLTFPIKGSEELLSFTVFIENDSCSIIPNGVETNIDIWGIEKIALTKIQAVYRAVIKFIKWYNLNKV